MTNTYTHPAEYWDRRALSGVGMAECGPLHAWLAAWVRLYTSYFDTMLEVGTGDGRIYEYLAKTPPLIHRYYGCDISHEYAKLCEERTGLRVDWWDGITLPYADDTFDWVLSFSVMLHVPPADIARHVFEMLRVARRYLFVSTYTGSGGGLAAHCFAHDYETLFDELRVVELREFPEEKNTQWLIAV